MTRFLIAAALVGALIGGAIAFGPRAQVSGKADHPTKCFGAKADVNRCDDPGGSLFVGTPRHDVIIASSFADHIEGRGGRDFICTRGNVEGGFAG
jgi:uncharacterized membrane protein